MGKGLFELARNVLDAIKETMDVETLDPNPPATSASNETSVVQLGVYDGKKILLTADVGPCGQFQASDCLLRDGLMPADSFDSRTSKDERLPGSAVVLRSPAG